MSGRVDDMRRARYEPAALWTKFVNRRKTCGSDFFAFVEGKDDFAYYPPRFGGDGRRVLCILLIVVVRRAS